MGDIQKVGDRGVQTVLGFDITIGGSIGPCNGQVIMSYGSYDYNQWSTCSKADFEEHYAAGNWGNGCLEDISGITFVYKSKNKI